MNNFMKAANRKAYRIVKKMGIPYCPMQMPMSHKNTGFDRAVILLVEDCKYWYKSYQEDNLSDYECFSSLSDN